MFEEATKSTSTFSHSSWHQDILPTAACIFCRRINLTQTTSSITPEPLAWPQKSFLSTVTKIQLEWIWTEKFVEVDIFRLFNNQLQSDGFFRGSPALGLTAATTRLGSWAVRICLATTNNSLPDGEKNANCNIGMFQLTFPTWRDISNLPCYIH